MTTTMLTKGQCSDTCNNANGLSSSKLKHGFCSIKRKRDTCAHSAKTSPTHGKSSLKLAVMGQRNNQTCLKCNLLFPTKIQPGIIPHAISNQAIPVLVCCHIHTGMLSMLAQHIEGFRVA